MNGTMHLEGLVPSLLVFGVIAPLPVINKRLPNHPERMAALITARAEMETITSALRKAQDIKSKLPPARGLRCNPGDEVRICREKDRRWFGPLKLMQAVEN